MLFGRHWDLLRSLCCNVEVLEIGQVAISVTFSNGKRTGNEEQL